MGSKRKTSTSQTTESTQTVTPSATPQETRLNELDLARREAAQPGLLSTQENAANIINQLLTGGELPGFLENLPGGISPEAIGTASTRVAREAGAGFQRLGIADSGTAFRETAADIAGRVQLPAEQFNLQNLFNLLATGIGGGTDVQQAGTQQSFTLGQRLAGFLSLAPPTSSLMSS